jgi:hypothetical protein
MYVSKNFIGKLQGKRVNGKRMHRIRDDIRKGLREIGF